MKKFSELLHWKDFIQWNLFLDTSTYRNLVKIYAGKISFKEDLFHDTSTYRYPEKIYC